MFFARSIFSWAAGDCRILKGSGGDPSSKWPFRTDWKITTETDEAEALSKNPFSVARGLRMEVDSEGDSISKWPFSPSTELRF